MKYADSMDSQISGSYSWGLGFGPSFRTTREEVHSNLHMPAFNKTQHKICRIPDYPEFKCFDMSSWLQYVSSTCFTESLSGPQPVAVA